MMVVLGQLTCGGVGASVQSPEGDSETTISPAASMTPEAVASIIFPDPPSYYTQQYFLEAFQPFVHLALWDDFHKSWGILYEEHAHAKAAQTPVRRLSPKGETKHIRCLFATFIGLWQDREQDTDWLASQTVTLYCMLNASKTHMTLIKAVDRDLADRIEKDL